MNVDAKVMEKLIKLLEMQRRGTEHEASVAAERAAELMARHQLEAIDVEAYADQREPIAKPEHGRMDDEEDAADGRRMEAWMEQLGATIAGNLGGRMYRTGLRPFQFLMIGPPGTVAAGRYMYMALRNEINRLGRVASRGESNAYRRAYCSGMVMRVGSRLYAGRQKAMSKATSTALAVVEKMSIAIGEEIAQRGLGKSRTGQLKRDDGELHGWIEGEKLDLGDLNRNQLGQGARRLKGK